MQKQKIKYLLPFITEDENVKDTTFLWSRLEVGYHYTNTRGQEKVNYTYYGTLEEGIILKFIKIYQPSTYEI